MFKTNVVRLTAIASATNGRISEGGEIVALLLEQDQVELNHTNKEGYTGLMWACMYCPMKFVIDLLKRQTVDVNLRSSTYFDTALNRAIVRGRKEIVVEF